MNMEKHVTIVGALSIGLGVLGVLTAAMVFLAAIIVFGSTVGAGALSGDQEALAITTAVGSGVGLLISAVALLLALLSVPDIIGGIALLKWKPWARILVLILSVFKLINIPIGTIVGIYSIWVLMQDETEELFAPGSSP